MNEEGEINRALPGCLLPLCQNEASCGNVFRRQVHFDARYHMNSFTRKLALKHSYKETRKWLVSLPG